MSITADTGDTWDTEVERQEFEFTIFAIGKTSFLEIWDDKTSETTVDMQSDFIG